MRLARVSPTDEFATCIFYRLLRLLGFGGGSLPPYSRIEKCMSDLGCFHGVLDLNISFLIIKFFESVQKSMEEKIAENAVLDYALFHVSSADNSYEALISSNGMIEKIAHGPFNQLAEHLPNARSLYSGIADGNFKLQPNECIKATWFTKFIVGRFLHIVNMPNVLNIANEIENEILQLEKTRQFHVSLYTKDHPLHLDGREADISCLNDSGLTQQVKVETASSDATKNELLRALELRLSTLKDELAAAFNHAAGATCSIIQILDLASFSDHFGATELRNSLMKFCKLCPNNLPFDIASNWQALNDLGNIKQEDNNCTLFVPKSDVVKPATTYVSPAKVAQAERQSSSEAEDCSDSSDRDCPVAERSRPIVRSATPRRSSSPMRRIQIGKSGSRRSTALTIKSLNYFPSREKAISNRDAEASVVESEEIEHLPNKPDINIFKKEKRLSSGKSSDSDKGISCSNLDYEPMEKKDELNVEFSNPENARIITSVEAERKILHQGINPESVVAYQVMETKDQISTAEWSVQKEAELNEMLIKMMESSKPTKYLGAKVVDADKKDASTDQKGGFYSQYKEKRDEKLRAENARNQAAKEAHLKVMHETLVQSKAAMTSKISGAAIKHDVKRLSTKPRRNSSPPILSNKEVSKPTSIKKPASKSSTPNPRSSLPSGSLKKTCTPPSKMSPAASSTSTTNRQRHQPSSLSSQPSPRSEKSLHIKKDSKSVNSIQTEPTVEMKEGKTTKGLANRSKSVKPISLPSTEDSGAFSRAGFQNRHTKKSTVVPLETKPFLRKGSGTSPGMGHSVSKLKDARIIKSADFSKKTGSHIQLDENQTSPSPPGSAIKVIEGELVDPTNVVDETLARPLDNDMNIQTAENVDGSLTLTDNIVEALVDTQNEDMSISSAAWVDVDNPEHSPSSNHEKHEVVYSPIIAPVISSSPRIRHSLSQMLLADNSEQEVIEWGNAENPPSLVYQKEAPKGLKRLLKFARKGKVEGSLTGLPSPSGLSDGEEEHEESKAVGKRSSDALQRKSLHHTKGHRQPKLAVSESFDSGNSSKRSMERSVLEGPSGSDKSRDVYISTAKSTRSFFSLSTFRSSKSGETKPR
ncbi:hypothetical protein HPP92_006421 [Vanilla planifolia]|uniref:Uncharacterized protein n=1 Tax=Vanilla planifolia TaxID=51239 RepID=A0A835RNU2_VANPL|nr:hypothetical protein HPP92_006421 [Vanilla planifolia]